MVATRSAKTELVPSRHVPVEETLCAICLVNVTDTRYSQVDSCDQHKFHEECIKKWTMRSQRCPCDNKFYRYCITTRRFKNGRTATQKQKTRDVFNAMSKKLNRGEHCFVCMGNSDEPKIVCHRAKCGRTFHAECLPLHDRRVNDYGNYICQYCVMPEESEYTARPIDDRNHFPAPPPQQHQQQQNDIRPANDRNPVMNLDDVDMQRGRHLIMLMTNYLAFHVGGMNGQPQPAPGMGNQINQQVIADQNPMNDPGNVAIVGQDNLQAYDVAPQADGDPAVGNQHDGNGDHLEDNA